MQTEKKLMIFSAPSGCGKTSLARALMARRGDVALSVSHTTRPMREGESEGMDYYFVSVAQFKDMIAANDFLEHAKVFDNYYGTSCSAVEGQRAAGKHVILDIDWQGARQVRALMPEVESVFILPPSIEALEARLRARGQDSDAVIARRMRDAKSEMSHQDEYTHTIINDDFHEALAEMETLF